MASTTSLEQLMQQLESLKRELEDCRKANEICQYNELKYRSLVEYANEGFILLDSNRVIIDVNKALLRISGCNREDFIGQSVDKFYDKTSVDFYSASRDHLSFEASFCAKSGTRIPMLFSRSILKDENQAFIGYMYFLSDLTELKATQEELKRAEHRYRNMYQNAVQAMFQSKLSGELIRVNPSYADILGYGSPEELLELKENADKIYFNPDDRIRMIRAVKKKEIGRASCRERV